VDDDGFEDLSGADALHKLVEVLSIGSEDTASGFVTDSPQEVEDSTMLEELQDACAFGDVASTFPGASGSDISTPDQVASSSDSDQSDEDVPSWRQLPDDLLRPPFPRTNIANYKQESILPGLRGQKVTLESLCVGVSDLLEIPTSNWQNPVEK